MKIETLEGGMVEEALKLGGEIVSVESDIKGKKFAVKKGDDGEYLAFDEDGIEYTQNEETGEWEKVISVGED
mgnify:FL=1